MFFLSLLLIGPRDPALGPTALACQSVFGDEPEAADVAAAGHAFLVIYLAAGERAHHLKVEMADLRIFHGELVKHAVVGLDHGRLVLDGDSLRVVAELIHHCCKLFNLLLPGSGIR